MTFESQSVRRAHDLTNSPQRLPEARDASLLSTSIANVIAARCCRLRLPWLLFRPARPVVIVNEANHGVIMSGHLEPEYRVGGGVSRVVFAPFAWIDRKLRPQYWLCLDEDDSAL